MGLDQSEVLTVGLLVRKEGRHTLPHNTLLFFFLFFLAWRFPAQSVTTN